MRKAIISIFTTGLMMCACNDAWNDHYQAEGTSDAAYSLYQLVEQNPDLSDFARLLQVTHLYNNLHVTPVTYAQLLNSDQSLTVWAPVNGTYNVDSLLTLCETTQGDSIVSQHFVGNHIAHHLYNMNTQTEGKVKMLNNKSVTISSGALQDVPVREGMQNLPATNGLLNVLTDKVEYSYNLYEGLTSLPVFAHIGPFMKSFEIKELDEENSIVADMVDGQKVYSDSVMIEDNQLFKTIDYINSEDSSFTMIVPTASMLEPLLAEAKTYFNFGIQAKADSIQNYWASMSLLQDLIYNNRTQCSLQDSVNMTSYAAKAYPYHVNEYPYHVYYRPLEAGGLLDPANFSSKMSCSNGVIYSLNRWPFTKQQLYFRPITIQAEREANLLESKDCTVDYRTVMADSVSGNGYMVIKGKTNTSNWTATFEVQNTLSGTYDVHAVILPKTVYNIYSRDKKPNKFTAVINYVDENGKKKSETFKNEISNDPYKSDTVLIGRVKLPVACYQQPEANVSVQLKCSITSRQTNYSREMYLDCIYLKPVEEE